MEEHYTIMDDPASRRSRFSKKELGDIAISMIVLSVAFAILYRGSFITKYLEYNFGESAKWVGLVGICLIIVTFSFLLHEFGHKFVAQKHGMWSEFRMYPMGLVLTLVTAFIGFLFAAPGAVMIAGYADKETNGKISIAGPAVNIVLSAIGIVGMTAITSTFGTVYALNDPVLLAYVVMNMLTTLNAFLAVFNLIPIPPLDGSKIIGWKPAIWIAAIAIAALELLFVYAFAPDVLYYYPH